MACPICKGTKVVDCPDCDGKGKKNIGGLLSGPKWIPCKHCKAQEE